jgi:dihydrofolate reductase
MGRLIYGMNQSLDGYIEGPSGGPAWAVPGPILFRHFTDHVRGCAGCLYGRRVYEVMRYWDDDHPEWNELEIDFAQAWRSKRKWVASRSLHSVGPNATLISEDLIAFATKLKAQVDGEIDVAGANLANELSIAGLVDEYRLYFRPHVLGGGKPCFAGPLPPLRLLSSDIVGEDAIRLTYIPA